MGITCSSSRTTRVLTAVAVTAGTLFTPVTFAKDDKPIVADPFKAALNGACRDDAEVYGIALDAMKLPDVLVNPYTMSVGLDQVTLAARELVKCLKKQKVAIPYSIEDDAKQDLYSPRPELIIKPLYPSTKV